MVQIIEADMVEPADVPSEHDTGVLLAAVRRRWPCLGLTNGELPGFRAAIEYLQFCQRGPLNLDRDPTHFCDQLAAWFRRRHGLDVRATRRAFVAAAVASNVCYSSLEHWPHDVSLGLSAFGMSGTPRAAWRATLAAGSVQEPATAD